MHWCCAEGGVTSAYKRKQNVVFYYWYPTPLVGSMDLVKLDMPQYDAEKHICLTNPKCDDPQPSAYPENSVFTALNTRFTQDAPKLTEFFSKVSVSLPVMDATLACMEDTGDDTDKMADWFLKNKSDEWTKWVPADVANRVQASL